MGGECAGPDHAQAPLRVEVVNQLSELERLKDDWEALNRRSSDHDAPFFQSYGWCLHVAKVRLERSPDRYRLCVATLWRGERLIGLWPLSVQRASGAWIVKNLDDPFGQFAGVVFENSADIPVGVEAVLDFLRTQRWADGLQIESVIAGSALHQALVAADASQRVSNRAVYVDLRRYRSFQEFMNGINKKTRKNLRNLMNRLRRSGNVEHVVTSDRVHVKDIIHAAFEGRLAWIPRTRFSRSDGAPDRER
jgi:CelD/BcsL family acetyltransferase involved in cellulose biosynthesis